jgi:WD40 repeat protein
VGTEKGEAVVLDCATGHERARFVSGSEAAGPIKSISFAADGTSVLLVAGATLTRWDLSTNQAISAIPVHHLGVAFNDDGSEALVITTSDGLWSIDPSSGQRRLQFTNRTATAAGYAGDGKHVFAIDPNGSVAFYESSAGALKRIVAAGKSPATAVAVAASTDLAFIGFADGSIQLIHLDDEDDTPGSFAAHVGAVEQIHLCRDGKTLITSGTDGVIKIWDIDSRSEIKRINSDASAASHFYLSRDESRLILSRSGDAAIHIYDLRLPKPIGRLQQKPDRQAPTQPSAD